MRRWFVGLLSTLMLSSTLVAQTPKTESVLVDGVAALVQGQVITLREVDLQARQLLASRLKSAAAKVTLNDAYRAKVLETMMVQEMLAYAARKEGQSVREREVESAHVAFVALMGEEAVRHLLETTAADEDQLRSIWRRDLIVKTYLKDSVFAELNDERAGAREDVFLKEHPEFEASRSQEERRNLAFEQWKKTQSERLLSAFLVELRQRIDVRQVARFE